MIELYVHVYNIKQCEKEGSLKKIGKSQNVGDIKEPLFRSNSDHITLHSSSYISKHWYIWKIGEETTNVQPNSKLLVQSYPGSIMPANDVVVQMRTGKSEFFFPKYEGEK